MPERRMFAKTIVLSDAFLDMPASARCLYFTLGMLADDDGFVNSPRSIMRQCGASEDDMKILLTKKFIIAFENGVIVIKHWRIHNYIQKDRKIPTKYEDLMERLTFDENNAYVEAEDGVLIEQKEKTQFSDARQKRIDAMKNSDLPYSFGYKMKQAFMHQRCPICNCEMNSYNIPTIQHNIPISKGGTHSIDNISIICARCNKSVQAKLTDKLNNDLVQKVWHDICNTPIGNGTGMDTQVNIGKDSINKYNIYSRAIEYLNSKAGTKYQVKSVANRRHIDARINEGYTFEDFKKVIDIKVAEWLGTDMQKYLRPETLFGSKFESYLNQKEATITSKKQVKVPEWYDKYQKGLKEEKVESIDEATKQQIEEAARGLFGDES